MEYQELKVLQSLPLEIKILKSQQRIREWYQHFGGNVYVAFSGGKDSTVLLDIVRKVYPDVPAVYADTGLEYPEIKEFVKSKQNVVIVRPKMSFIEVINNFGYPVVSKNVARYVRDIRNDKGKNELTKNLRLFGIKKDGTKSLVGKLSKKWHFLIDAPFKISEQCCDIMKKSPMKNYQKESGRVPFLGTMAEEGRSRQIRYLQNGCNSFRDKSPTSSPIGFWTEQDILRYIKEENLPYASVYGEIIEVEGKFYTTGEKRTGCMFCAFGVHLEKGENRFQRMKRTHPKFYQYCMETLKLKEILDFIKVPY